MYLLIDDSPRRLPNRAATATSQPFVRTLVVLMALTTGLALCAWAAAAPVHAEQITISAVATD